MKLRLISTAVLFYGNEMLMMKRSPNRTLSPGMWAGVGGHLEPFELQSPRAAGLREIYEETGFTENELIGLRLQYLLFRRKEDEIRQQFIYFARTTHKEVITTEEGELHWIPIQQVMQRNIPFTYRVMLEHYFKHGPSPHVWLGAISLSGSSEEGQPTVEWSSLLDPLVN